MAVTMEGFVDKWWWKMEDEKMEDEKWNEEEAISSTLTVAAARVLRVNFTQQTPLGKFRAWSTNEFNFARALHLLQTSWTCQRGQVND